MQIIKTQTEDGLVLSGLLSESQNKEKVILHVHGMASDFYTGSYFPLMHDQYFKKGFSFLSVELRGTHTIRPFKTNNGIRIIGNAYEKFEDCVLDIGSWVNKLTSDGYNEIWLQSHSLGTCKAAHYTSKNNDKISGNIFISPSEMVGLVHDPEGYEDHKVMMPQAKELVKAGKPDKILDRDLWGVFRLSAGTYVNFFSEDSNTAVFNYWKPELGWDVVSSISSPVLAITGTKDDGITPVIDPFDAMKMLRSNFTNSPRVETKIYEGAEHDFNGFEQKIVDDVINFID